MTNSFLSHSPEKDPKDKTSEHMPDLAYEPPPHNTSEGGEFLDDAIRMVDQPLLYVNDALQTDEFTAEGDTQ